MIHYFFAFTILAVNVGCALATDSNLGSSSPTSAPTTPGWIDTVHVVFTNHLDVGFNVGDPDNTPGFSHNVVNYYFDHYFPMAVAVGDNCTQLYNLTFTWLTHGWLLSMYFDCPPNMELHCPSESDMNYIKYGINKGYIRWHAFPFNSQLELYDKNMVEFGIKLTHDLYDKFDIINEKSIVISQRDVPGMTRSMIPILKNNNVNGITIGCNGGSAPPAVPKIFHWKDSVSNELMITMVHPGGYGGISLNDAVYLNNWNQALVFMFKGDNAGPPTVGQVAVTYLALANEFPEAAQYGNGTKNENGKGIFASTYTNFVNELMQNEDALDSLEVFDEEMDDTWVHGPASDPWKLSAFRVMQRQRTQCLESNQCSLDSYPFYNFSRLLLKNGEHTFGGDIKSFLNAYVNGSDYYCWSNPEFNKCISANNGNNNMTTFRSTWYEQRDWGLEYAMQSLSYSNNTGDINLFKSIDMEIMSQLHDPKIPLLNNYTNIINKPNQIFNIGNQIEISFDTTNTGGINYLYNKNNNINYANDNNVIGEFIYQTFTENNFINFIYNYSWHPWESYVTYDFGKHLLNEYCKYCEYQYISANIKNIYENNNNIYNNSKYTIGKFIIEWQIGDTSELQSNLHEYYGTPSSVFNEITINTNSNSNNGIEIDFQITWINKTATRIPETLWFAMNPLNCNNYKVDKLSEAVNVGAGYIMNNGSFHLHATTGNVSCSINNNNNKNNMVNVESIDAALVGFIPQGATQLTPFPVPFANVTENGDNTGFGFILYDNIWGTNYPVWYPFDESNTNHTFRFAMYL